jgi:catechol 2,3-dioxygenase-like lactoylglutathione lyase family enzyme
MFDVGKARAFYVDLLGFRVDWEHRFEPGFPLYMQVSRGSVRLHLSEHHGDGTPGSVVFVDVTGLDAFHAELQARGSRAEIEPGPNPDMRVLSLWDPFGSRLRFAETRTRTDGELPAGRSLPAGAEGS